MDPLAQAIGQRLTFDELHDEEMNALGLLTWWMPAMLGWFSEARTLASRSKRARRSGSAMNGSGNTLIATSRPSLVSSARYTLPHSTLGLAWR